MLDKNIEAFVIYIKFQVSLILIYFNKKTQIALLIIEKIKIPAKYLNFSNIFLDKKNLVLLKLIDLN